MSFIGELLHLNLCHCDFETSSVKATYKQTNRDPLSAAVAPPPGSLLLSSDLLFTSCLDNMETSIICLLGPPNVMR